MKNLTLILLALLCIMPLRAQSQHRDPLLYKAYLTASPTLWKQGVAQKQQQYAQQTNRQHLWALSLASLGLLNNTMATKDQATFDAYVDDTVEKLEQLIEGDGTWGEPKAVLSAVMGMKMAFSPWKGVYLGYKSSDLMETALKQSPESALVWKLYAQSKLFTPEAFGGDKQEAQKAFEKAIMLFESEPETLAYNWLYLDALAWQGQTYRQTGKQEYARNTYKKALEAEPEFMWVRKVLLPAIE